MLESGKSYKVKVELEQGRVGYGRATILDKSGSRIFIQVRTAKELNCSLPIGSKLWFVCDAPGLCSTEVVGSKRFSGKTAMECAPLKFEPITQRRKSQRISFKCPVRLADQNLPYILRSRNISRSGIGLEAYSQYIDEFPVGNDVEIVLETSLGNVKIKCKVIRTEYNWLSNRSTIGLQFLEMSQDAVEILERLRGPAEEQEAVESQSSLSKTLSGSLRKFQDNTKLTRQHLNKQADNSDKLPEEEDFD